MHATCLAHLFPLNFIMPVTINKGHKLRVFSLLEVFHLLVKSKYACNIQCMDVLCLPFYRNSRKLFKTTSGTRFIIVCDGKHLLVQENYLWLMRAIFVSLHWQHDSKHSCVFHLEDADHRRHFIPERSQRCINLLRLYVHICIWKLHIS
jgi:hypothetical protein